MLHRICSLLRIRPPVKSDSGLLMGSGSVIPTDGDKGWQKGSIFQKTHEDGALLYINEGSIANCAFKTISEHIVTMILQNIEE